MEEIYGEAVAQRLSDPVWIRRCANEGWVVLTKDKRLRNRNRKEYRAIIRHGAKIFSLPRGGLTEEQQIARFVNNCNRIAMRCKKPGPFIARVMEDTVEWYLAPPKKP